MSGNVDNERLTQAIDDISAVRETFRHGNGQTSKSIYKSLSVALDIIEHYHLAFWQYGRVEGYYSCERCGRVIDWYGLPVADLPDRCAGCGNYMHKITRPDPKEWPEPYKPKGLTFTVDKVEKVEKVENASCENCEHAYRGADPLKLLQDPGNAFSCSAGFKYGGVDTVCSEWKLKEGGDS